MFVLNGILSVIVNAKYEKKLATLVKNNFWHVKYFVIYKT